MKNHQFNVADKLNLAKSGVTATMFTTDEPLRSDAQLILNSPIKLSYCPRCQGLYFFNIRTGQYGNANCKAYCCDYCGPKKAYKLELALCDYFQQYKHLRLFTFTFRTTAIDESGFNNKIASEIWRRFINNLRRSTSLNDCQRNVDYVRVLEYTKRGYPHFHVFMSEYMPIQVIRGIWHNAINQVLGSKGVNGNVQVTYSGSATSKNDKGNYTPEKASKYVAKYVVKTAKEKKEGLRNWSKSGKVKIFPDKLFSCGWFFFNERSLNLNLNEFCVTSRPPSPIRQKIRSLYEIVCSQMPDLNLDAEIDMMKKLDIEGHPK